MRFYGGFDRAKQYMGIAAFHARQAIRGAIGKKVLGEPKQQFAAEIGVSDLTSAELYDGLDAVSLLQETDRVVLLEVVIVVVRIGAELEFLHLDNVLFLLGFVLFLLELVLIVAVVDCLGDGRDRRWRNHHEI